MRKEVIEEKVAGLITTLITGTEIELVDVEYIREYNNWYLRIFIDRPQGILLDDCQLVSQQISKLLDENEIISDSYFLEISSPGLDRKLKKNEDFVKFVGRLIDIHLYAAQSGKKILTGELVGLTADNNILRYFFDGSIREIARKAIAQVRLHIDF